MLQVCADEHQLFRECFTLGDETLQGYLEEISSILSDQIRPLILKETRIDTLAELCSSLLFYIQGAGTATENPERTLNDSRDAAIKVIVKSILFDGQGRLSFRAQEFIQSEIRQFKSNKKEMSVLTRVAGRNLVSDHSTTAGCSIIYNGRCV